MGTKGKFIVFEGLDGSGKTTQINLLAKRIKALGGKVHCTAEPTVSGTGGLLRDALSGDYKRTPSEMAALFLADRVAHNVNASWGIKKYIDEGYYVISDRYYYSTFAYQGVQTDMKWLVDMNMNCPDIMRPDICIFLNITAESSKKRIDAERTHLEVFETESFLNSTRKKFFEAFELIKDKENIVIIDADRDIDTVAEDIFAKISSL